MCLIVAVIRCCPGRLTKQGYVALERRRFALDMLKISVVRR
jgi:hypothetical protein